MSDRRFDVAVTIELWAECECPNCDGHKVDDDVVYLDVVARNEEHALRIAKQMLDEKYSKNGRFWEYAWEPEVDDLGEIPEDRRMALVGAPRLFEVA